MKGANKLFIFAGVALALVAVLIGITMSSDNKVDGQVDETAPSKVKVVKALVDLEPYTLISMADVEVVEVPSDEAPAGAAGDLDSVINQAYTIRAATGDILLSSFLQLPGITSSIETGKRAVSLEVDTRGMMSGLIMEGDYVDLVFDARVDINRIIAIQGVEIMEDGDYVLADDDDNDEGDGDGDGDGDENNNEDEDDNDNQIIPGTEASDYQGKPGTEFTITDSGLQLEPVTKMLVQDVKVLRVIKPGVEFDSQGQQVQGVAEGGSPGEDSIGQLVLEVTPQQAEAITFMQNSIDDPYASKIEVVVRAKDDHEVASTTGITFQILIDDQTWSLPWPQPVTAPEGTRPEE